LLISCVAELVSENVAIYWLNSFMYILFIKTFFVIKLYLFNFVK
jgi:hypothetical protein